MERLDGLAEHRPALPRPQHDQVGADRADRRDRLLQRADRLVDLAGLGLQPADPPEPEVGDLGRARALGEEQRAARQRERRLGLPARRGELRLVAQRIGLRAARRRPPRPSPRPRGSWQRRPRARRARPAGGPASGAASPCRRRFPPARARDCASPQQRCRPLRSPCASARPAPLSAAVAARSGRPAACACAVAVRETPPPPARDCRSPARGCRDRSGSRRSAPDRRSRGRRLRPLERLARRPHLPGGEMRLTEQALERRGARRVVARRQPACTASSRSSASWMRPSSRSASAWRSPASSSSACAGPMGRPPPRAPATSHRPTKRSSPISRTRHHAAHPSAAAASAASRTRVRAQAPVNSGGRFSRKARRPST